MARASRIDRMPAEIRDEIGALRRAGRTLDEILAKLRELGVADLPRSTLGDYTKKIDALIGKATEARAVAEALVSRFGDEPDDKLFRANIEMMQGLVFRLTTAEMQGEVPQFSSQELMFLSSTIKNIGAAAKTDADRIAKAEERATKRARAEAEQKVRAGVEGVAAQAAGLSGAEVLRRIRQDVYGIFL